MHLQNDIEKATFTKLYLISQGRVPLMNLSAVIDTVGGHHQKENILWMLLLSFYHAGIVSHENTGKVSLKEKSTTNSTDIDRSPLDSFKIILRWFNRHVSKFLCFRNDSIFRIFLFFKYLY